MRRSGVRLLYPAPIATTPHRPQASPRLMHRLLRSLPVSLAWGQCEFRRACARAGGIRSALHQARMREIGELRRGRVQVHAEIGGSRGKLPDAAGEGKERHRNAPGLCNNPPVPATPAPVRNR